LQVKYRLQVLPRLPALHLNLAVRLLRQVAE
jgi:hypothetical protein